MDNSLLINTINKQNHILANTPNTTDHIFISDLNGILSGKDSSNCQCSVCTSGQVPPYNPDVSGPLKWVTENPGRQILTGSFHFRLVQARISFFGNFLQKTEM